MKVLKVGLVKLQVQREKCNSQVYSLSPGLDAQASNDLSSAKSAINAFWQNQVQNGRLQVLYLGENVGFPRTQLKVRPFQSCRYSPAEEEGPGCFVVKLFALHRGSFDIISQLVRPPRCSGHANPFLQRIYFLAIKTNLAHRKE